VHRSEVDREVFGEYLRNKFHEKSVQTSRGAAGIISASGYNRNLMIKTERAGSAPLQTRPLVERLIE
jgi:hypothetical protein